MHGTRWMHQITLIGLVLTAASVCRAEDLSTTIDSLAQQAIDAHRTAALGIAIDRGGTTALNKGYGYADIENQVAATPDTIYRIGSVTKQFTAVAILQLEAAGKLSLSDSITALVPEYPAPPKPITVKNLLQHTSGIPDFTNNPSHRPNAYKDMSHAEMIARFDSLPLEFDPGSQWRYSNSGYYLLGMIIEHASGETYPDYMASHVLAPAGMQHSRYETRGDSERAMGYRPTPGGLAAANAISMSQPFSAGALVSTTGDLLKWQRALVEKRITPPLAFERMTTETVRGQKLNEQYGYGLRVASRDGHKVIAHGGGIEGFSSLLAYYPEIDCTVAILANTEGFNISELLPQIERVIFGAAKQ